MCGGLWEVLAKTTLGLDLCRVETGARWKTGTQDPLVGACGKSHQGHLGSG